MFSEISNFLAAPSEKPKIVCVIGPTASGKTALAVEIAQKYHGEIINTDSRQMYRFLNIGTAKPTEEEKQGIPHHLFDILDPREEANVGIWRPLAEEKIRGISRRGKLPILCGGTGLFMNALLKNFTLPKIPPQPEFRKKMEEFSPEVLWNMLQYKDPEEAKKLHPNNQQLVIRALEICEFSEKKKSELTGQQESPYSSHIIGITLERAKLYEKIDLRVEYMKKNGFLKEVRDLLDQGYSLQDPAMNSHGYPEAIRFLHGELSEDQLWGTMQRNTRHYAKRQLTWWRREPAVHWHHGISWEKIEITSEIF